MTQNWESDKSFATSEGAGRSLEVEALVKVRGLSDSRNMYSLVLTCVMKMKLTKKSPTIMTGSCESKAVREKGLGSLLSTRLNLVSLLPATPHHENGGVMRG